MEKQIKIIVGYIIDKSITIEEEIKQYFENLLTYVNQIDKLYIYCLKIFCDLLEMGCKKRFTEKFVKFSINTIKYNNHKQKYCDII